MPTVTVSADVIIKAGAGVGAVPADSWDKWIDEAEGVVAAISRYDWAGNWLTISSNAMAPLVTQTVEDLAAINGVVYDMSGYTSRIEAEDMVNVLRDSALRGLSLLRDQKVVTFGT